LPPVEAIPGALCASCAHYGDVMADYCEGPADCPYACPYVEPERSDQIARELGLDRRTVTKDDRVAR
jgi:hypothetical protein